MKIEGFFRNLKEANDAVAQLKQAGYTHAVVDINDHYIDDRDVQINTAGSENAPSLSGLVLTGGPKAIDETKRTLTAASPMVSGMGGFDEIADVNCKVIVNLEDKNKADTVKLMLSNMGANLDSPNIKTPKITDDADILFGKKLEAIRENID